MNKIAWHIKQLLPLRYKTHYTENGERHYCEWRMWFGRCFDVRDVVVG